MYDLGPIVAHIKACEQKLAIINTELAKELQKPPQQRKKSLLMFLNKEKSVYDFALSILQDLQRHATTSTESN